MGRVGSVDLPWRVLLHLGSLLGITLTLVIQ